MYFEHAAASKRTNRSTRLLEGVSRPGQRARRRLRVHAAQTQRCNQSGSRSPATMRRVELENPQIQRMELQTQRP